MLKELIHLIVARSSTPLLLNYIRWGISKVVCRFFNRCQHSLIGNYLHAFLSYLLITHGCLLYLKGLTISLQVETKDIMQAVSEINSLKSIFKQVWVDVVAYHSKWFSTVTKMCEEVGTIIYLPRICGHQCHRSNTPPSNPCDFF